MLTNNQNKNPKKPLVTNFIRNLLPFGVRSQQGSTLPMAIGLGSAMMVVGTLAVMKGGQENTNTTSSEQTKQALAIAEAGVTRMQGLFAEEPRLAMVSQNSDTQGWTDVLNDNDLQGKLNEEAGVSESGEDYSCNANNSGSSDSGLSDEEIKAKLQGEVAKIPSNQVSITAGQNDWITLGNGHQYRLVSYTNNNGLGRLAVQGKVGNNNNSTAQINVEFDARVIGGGSTSSGTSEGVAALWISDSGNNFGNNKIAGNVKIYSSTCKTKQQLGNNAPSDSNLINGGKLEISSEPIPATPALPNSGSTGFYEIATPITGDETFPRLGSPAIPQQQSCKTKKGVTTCTITQPAVPAVPADVPDANGYYHYLIPSLTYSGNQNLTISPNAKVVFYLQGDFNIGGNSDISVDSSSKLEVYGNTNLGGGNFKYGCNLVGSSNCGTDTVLIRGGTAAGNIFIHAVDATAGVNGGGNVNPNFRGSIWAKNWDASSANTIALGSQGTYNDYLSGKDRTIPGKPTYELGNITNWTRQAVSQN